MEHECCKNAKDAEHKKHLSSAFLAIVILLAGAVIVQAYNFTQISKANFMIENQAAKFAGPASQDSGTIDMSDWTDNEKMNYEMHGIIPARSGGASAKPSAPNPENYPDVIPKGIPKIYGKELGISFDDISVNDPAKADLTISVLAKFDREKGAGFIPLSGEKEQRYIKIASQISCEYCCGAQSIIFSNGKAACGCAHSYAMRGLARYLLEKHGSEFTDDQILEELGKWKTLFFPGAISQKAKVLEEKGIELNYINLTSNKYRGAEKGSAQGEMVGGC